MTPWADIVGAEQVAPGAPVDGVVPAWVVRPGSVAEVQACVALGGSLTGEHGIGVEKIGQMPLLFGPEDLAAMVRLRAVFDPEGRANPHKIFPDAKMCVETRAPRRQAAM